MTAWTDAVTALSPHVWYRHAEASGSTLTDSSGNARHGTYNNTGDITYAQPSLVPSDSNSSVLFAGNGFWNKGSGLSFNRTNVTYHTVIKSTDGSGDIFYVDSNTRLNFSGIGGNTTVFLNATAVPMGVSPATIFDGNPHDIVLVVGATTVKLYVDFVLVSSQTHAVSGGTHSSIRTLNMLGTFDEFFLLAGTQMSGAQVTALGVAFQGVTAPGVPTSLTIDPTTTTADFDWGAPASGGAPTGYRIRLNGGSSTDVGNVLTHNFTGLTASTAYSSPGAEVQAYNAGGSSAWASISFTTDDPAPAAPTGLTIDPAVTTADLDWNASTYADGYEVRLNGGSPTNVGNVLTHTFTGLTGATAYTFEVRAFNETGSSSWASIGGTTDDPAPAAPTGLSVDPGPTTLALSWVASTYADGYEVRIDGGTATDVGNVLTHTFTGLGTTTGHTLEARAYNETGTSAWASISSDTEEAPEYLESVRIVIGPDDDLVDVQASAVNITIRRGLSGPGVTNTLEPGYMQAIIRDASVNPTTDENTRPNRPIRILGLAEDLETWEPVFTGTIRRARLVFTQYEEVEEISVVIDADDSVAVLANLPSTTAVGGTFAQRVAHILEPTGLAYAVTDTQPDASSTPALLTEETTALGQLVLARDTLHGVVHVDKAGVIQAYADRDRPSVDIAVTFTDAPADSSQIPYTHLEPDYDTSDLVNVIDIETVGQENPDTFSDADSVAEWGPVRDRVRVNGGSPANHAARYMAGRIEPKLIVKRVQFNATKSGIAKAVGLEVNTAAQVVRAGLVDDTFQILGLEHTITARRWLTAVTLRTLERLPIRWMDVPDDITWADVPADLTWNDAALWEPT